MCSKNKEDTSNLGSPVKINSFITSTETILLSDPYSSVLRRNQNKRISTVTKYDHGLCPYPAHTVVKSPFCYVVLQKTSGHNWTLSGDS